MKEGGVAMMFESTFFVELNYDEMQQTDGGNSVAGFMHAIWDWICDRMGW